MTRPRKSDVPRELDRAGALCLAFANTEVPIPPNRRTKTPGKEQAYFFDDYAELLTWARRMGILTAAEAELLGREADAHPRDATEVLVRARELRAALMRLFTALALGNEPRAKHLDTLNAALSVPRVVPGAGRLDFHREPGGDPMALDRVLAAVAHSAADLLSSKGLERLRQCGAEDCWRLFVHRSSRRLWCDMNLCGNRLKTLRRQR